MKLPFLVLLAACAPLDPDTDVVVSNSNTCPLYSCNSPEVVHGDMHEANLDGEPNMQGFRLKTDSQSHALIFKDGTSYRLHVGKSRIFGLDAAGNIALQGPALEGAEIYVMRGYSSKLPSFIIHIDSRRPIWAPFDNVPLEAYTLSWRYPDQGPTPDQPLCNPYAYPEYHKGDPDDMMGMQPGETLVFEGDRVDPDTMTFRAGAWPRWFNFGCAAHTLAKLRLSRNTPWYSGDRPGSQATLKLLVGDYCGHEATGFATPMTVAGTPLVWQGGLMTYSGAIDGLEARWDEHGARCINVPRMDLHPDAPWDYGVLPDIHACGVPACTDLDVLNLDGALRISGNSHLQQ